MDKNKINILPENLSNKIAAGEVVERPASVVKELVENAIDAGAREITVVVKDGGKALVQVVDDGFGMTRDDLILAFQRHATSKIQTLDDLENIQSLGFRGEALASIASVSRIEARSMLHGENYGQLLRIEGGVMHDIEVSSGTPGTSIAVKHLFYNTPARRKFLKATTTEYRQILNVMNRFFLAFPDVAFSFVNEGELIHEFPVHDPVSRLRAVLGERIQKNMIEIENEGYLEISGFIGNQDIMRRSRGDQYLFLNKRYFANKSLHYAVVSAYGDILQRGYYPIYVIHFKIDPRQVDVNIHPTKLEVRFTNEGLVFNSLRGAVKRALSSTSVIPALSPFRKMEQPGPTSLSFSQTELQYPKERAEFDPSQPGPFGEKPPTQQKAGPFSVEKELGRKREIFERTNVWQVHNKYIISQITTGLIIIDQHVAHERILYEKALENFEKRKPSSQQLLFPHIIELSAEDYSMLLEILPFLEHIGFVIKSFSKNTVVLEGVPSGIKISNDEKILLDILDEYKRGKKDHVEIRDNVAKSFACHSAIRAGEPLSLPAMNALIDQLFATKEPYFCPHGRPVIINIPLEELDKRFRRH